MARYRNRKGFIGQNVLAACNFAMFFVYILSGWEGSASDSLIYEYAREHDFAVPVGKFYLADAGFLLCDALITPYRGVRYHLKEWGTISQMSIVFSLRSVDLILSQAEKQGRTFQSTSRPGSQHHRTNFRCCQASLVYLYSRSRIPDRDTGEVRCCYRRTSQLCLGS
jgi:hypothetical protein